MKQYIEETEQFYKQRADGVLLESNDTQSYMRFACRALEEEEKRCEKYLLAISRSHLMEILTQVLVVNNAELIRFFENIGYRQPSSDFCIEFCLDFCLDLPDFCLIFT